MKKSIQLDKTEQTMTKIESNFRNEVMEPLHKLQKLDINL